MYKNAFSFKISNNVGLINVYIKKLQINVWMEQSISTVLLFDNVFYRQFWTSLKKEHHLNNDFKWVTDPTYLQIEFYPLKSPRKKCID